MRDTFVNTLFQIAKNDKRVYIITGDLGFNVLTPFFEHLPDQIINVGIAEQAMTGIAAGLAMSGKIVYTYSIANFSTLRCLEQIRNDCAYHNANVKIVAVGGGMAYGTNGMSHHATEDIAIMRALPDVTVMAPGDPMETVYATRALYEQSGTCYLRLGRGGEKTIHKSEINLPVGNAVQLFHGEKIALLSTGGILDEAVNAHHALGDLGINISLYTFPTIKPIDKELIEKCANQYDYIITLEEHNLSGGFGSCVAEVLAEIQGSRAVLKRFGIHDQYTSIVGRQSFLRAQYGITSNDIVKKVIDIVN